MSSRTLKAISACLLFGWVMTATLAEAGPLKGWRQLGQLTVTDGLDHDALVVTGARGDFRKLQVRVFERAVQFRSMKVHFANGDVQDVELRDVIPAGGQSRIIDIEGVDRVIRKIEFWYDAQARGGKRARVRVYGQH